MLCVCLLLVRWKHVVRSLAFLKLGFLRLKLTVHSSHTQLEFAGGPAIYLPIIPIMCTSGNAETIIGIEVNIIINIMQYWYKLSQGTVLNRLHNTF